MTLEPEPGNRGYLATDTATVTTDTTGSDQADAAVQVADRALEITS